MPFGCYRVDLHIPEVRTVSDVGPLPVTLFEHIIDFFARHPLRFEVARIDREGVGTCSAGEAVETGRMGFVRSGFRDREGVRAVWADWERLVGRYNAESTR